MRSVRIGGTVGALALMLAGTPLEGTVRHPIETRPEASSTPVCVGCEYEVREAGSNPVVWYGYVEWGGPCGGSDCISCEPNSGGPGCPDGDYESEAFDDQGTADLYGAAMCSGCGGGGSPLGELPSLVLSKDVAAIADLIRQSDGTVFINSERSAVQGLGCAGTVSYHVALPAALLAAVTVNLASSN